MYSNINLTIKPQSANESMYPEQCSQQDSQQQMETYYTEDIKSPTVIRQKLNTAPARSAMVG